jgi:hypothetical protein
MWLYLWLLLLPLALAATARLPEKKRDIVFWVIGIALVLFIGLRREVGCDWRAYISLLRVAAILPIQEALVQRDPGYMALNIAVARAGFGLGVVNFICSALFVSGLLVFVRRQPLPHLALLIAIPVLVLIAGLSATRQGVAIGLSLWALSSLAKGQRKVPILLLVVGGLFHWTAFVLLPLAPMMLLARRTAERPVLYALLAAGVPLVLFLFAAPQMTWLFPRYEPSGGAIFRAAPTVLALLILLAAHRRLLRSPEDRLITAYLAGIAVLSLALLPFANTIADRLGFYAVALQMLVLARAPLLAPEGRTRLLAQAVIALPFVVLILGWLAMTDAKACYTPYRSFLSDPAELRMRTPVVPSPTADCAVELKNPHRLVARAHLVVKEGEPASEEALRMCARVLIMQQGLDRPGEACAVTMRRLAEIRAIRAMEPQAGRRYVEATTRQCVAALKERLGPPPAP